MEWLSDPQSLIAFGTLVALELVLGVDNVIFISILADKLPEEQRARARLVGLSLAVISRLLLLLSLSWVIGLTETLVSVMDFDLAGRDLILIIGGLFLIAKSTHEIHGKLEGVTGHASGKVKATFTSVIIQVLMLDLVFSLDSVITAVGMVDEIAIMASAVIIAAIVMILAASAIGAFVDRHPTIKVLALSFLLLIGFTLVVEGFHHHVPKGYIYSAMAFSLFVETLNLRLRKVKAPVELHSPYAPEQN